MLCTHTDAVVIDLAVRLGWVMADGEGVTLGDGATVGAMNHVLHETGDAVPVGASPPLGLGLVLRGGIGHISRSYGLTIDHLVDTEVVLRSGEVRLVSAESTGEDADLWWALRGAGPMVGAVAEATLATIELPAVTQRRLVLPLDADGACLQLAPTLPRNVSQSLVLAPPGGADAQAVLPADVVIAGEESQAQGLAGACTEALDAAAGVPDRLFDETKRVAYTALDPMHFPHLPGHRTQPAVAEPVHVLVKSNLLSESAGADAARVVVDAMGEAPSPLCRIDFQHAGGVVNSVPGAETVFANRDFHWNCVVVVAWSGRGHHREAEAWVHRVVEGLAPWIAGVYSVEVHPDRPETPGEVGLAFGDNLPRLRRIADRVDPKRILLSHQLIA